MIANLHYLSLYLYIYSVPTQSININDNLSLHWVVTCVVVVVVLFSVTHEVIDILILVFVLTRELVIIYDIAGGLVSLNIKISIIIFAI